LRDPVNAKRFCRCRSPAHCFPLMAAAYFSIRGRQAMAGKTPPAARSFCSSFGVRTEKRQIKEMRPWPS